MFIPDKSLIDDMGHNLTEGYHKMYGSQTSQHILKIEGTTLLTLDFHTSVVFLGQYHASLKRH